MPDGLVLLIACDEISTVVPLLHGDFIEHKVVHVNQDFARRFWLHLDAELTDSIHHCPHGFHLQMELLPTQHFLILCQNIEAGNLGSS